MPRRPAVILLALALVLPLGSCSTGNRRAAEHEPAVGSVPLYEGLGSRSRKISTTSREAQRYFDQGIAFLFAFNHDEAIRSFRKAAELDPHAPMAWWGISVASGPHINFPMMTPESSKVAWTALERARKEADGNHATAVERDLIEALRARYADPPPADRAPLDLAYANAMRSVWQKHPTDADIGALFAESMMDLRPWNQWTPEGNPQPGTEEVLSTLDTVMKLDPDQPLALHLYIHATEASRNPGRAEQAANRLRDLQPGLGHLVHMPSHTDVRLGHWREAVTSNAKAVRADTRYRSITPKQGFYGLYMAHNHHMLAFAAMMIGRRAEALDAIDTMAGAIPPSWAKENALIADGFLAMPVEVRLRFAMWDEVLAAPEPEATFPFARAMRLYARAVALNAKGDTAAARAEQKAFAAARAALPASAIFGNNSAPNLLTVADRVLEGEISYREGKHEQAFKALREAVVHESQLRYDEPPSWILPARHSLGAALLDAGRAAEAEKVFRDDLKHLPHNGWGLYGLEKSLRMQRKNAEAQKVAAEFRKAWAGADFTITSPCACISSAKS